MTSWVELLDNFVDQQATPGDMEAEMMEASE